jgi:MerR family transcriptional regulator, copper efflux regulator
MIERSLPGLLHGFLPIGDVARRFRIRASALRYYEDIGLLVPAMRRSGRRFYGPAELTRLALIQLLQDAGQHSLEEIADILKNRAGGKSSRKILMQRIALLESQISTAEAAKRYLEHRLSCPREDPFDGCPELAKEVGRRLQAAGLYLDAGSVHAAGAHEGHCSPAQPPPKVSS